MSTPPFHLAVPVHNLQQARAFYVDLLGCDEGRSAPRWLDLNFFGHQVSLHLSDAVEHAPTNAVDGDQVPVRHFGAILEWRQWEALGQRLQASGQTFIIPPRVRFAGEVGEQGTFFLRDPSGNALEFKSFRDPAQIFAR